MYLYPYSGFKSAVSFPCHPTVWSWPSPASLHRHAGTTRSHCRWFLAGRYKLPLCCVCFPPSFLFRPKAAGLCCCFIHDELKWSRPVDRTVHLQGNKSALFHTDVTVFILTRVLCNRQMVWENGCTVIVMMTALVEDGEKQCERYWPDEGSSLYHIYEVNFLLQLIKPEFHRWPRVLCGAVGKASHTDL